jgi:hypothetical protein
MIRAWLSDLDTYGMADPDNNEGQPEDRCTVCEWPISDHHPTYSRSWPPARWPHRRAVIRGLIAGALP